MHIKASTWLYLIALLLMSGHGTETLAQSSGATTASVTGIVKDTQGAVLGGATITVRQAETNLVHTTLTGEDGYYLIVQLPPGSYQITAASDGFTPRVIMATLTVATTALASFTLSAAGSNEVIEVEADTVIALEPGKTEKSSVVSDDELRTLPAITNFASFALITPGVVSDRIPLQGTQPTSALNFNGTNARQNNITIDGVDNNDASSGAVRATFSQDAVKEFKVISNSFAAEYGRAQGGVVSIVTKSGTNEWHGAFSFPKTTKTISARNAFDTSRERPPSGSSYAFSGALSGPLARDRKFFFLSYQRAVASGTTKLTIPDDILVSLNRVGFPVRNDQIPAESSASSLLARVDLRLNANNQLLLRYNFGGSFADPTDFGGTNGAGSRQRLRDDNIAILETYAPGGNALVNEFRFLYARRDLDVAALDPLGPGLALLTPNASVLLGRGTFLPDSRAERTFQLVDNISLLRGRHQLKLGVDYLDTRLPDNSTQSAIFYGGVAFFQPINFGVANFSALALFDPAVRTPEQQAFLLILSTVLPTRFPGFPKLDLTRLSIPINYIQGFGEKFVTLKYKYISAFVQDDIRLSRNLTAKLGLRYDQERIEFVPKNRGNFSPRVALAYSLKDRLNLHAAYGIFHGITPFQPILLVELGQKGLKIPVVPFPFSILPFARPSRNFPESPTLPPELPFIPQLSFEQQIQTDYRNGYTQQGNVGFDFLLNRDTVVSASYEYVRGVKLFLSRDINPVVRPVPDPLASRINGRIDPTRGTVGELESAGDSYYNAFTLQVQRRFGSRFSVRANYTFAKAIDNFVDYRTEIAAVSFNDSLNLRGERALSGQDVRNRFIFAGIWNLDYNQHPVLRDFTISTIVRVNSGLPYNLIAGTDLNMSADLAAGDRPRIGGVPIGRNAGISPGFAQVDLRLRRQVKFKERYTLEASFDVFNLFNRVNFTASLLNNVFPQQPDGSFNLPAKQDGRFILPRELIRGTFSPRTLQLFQLRFTF